MTQAAREPGPEELDRRIAELSRLMNTVPTWDLPARSGLLGELLLERYELAGHAADLRAGLTRLRFASAGAPEHPETPIWCYLLGVGYGARAAAGAAAGAEPADWDTAIGWMTRSLTGTRHSRVDPDTTTADLALLHFRRFHARAPELDPATARDEADRLVGSLTELTVSGPGSAPAGVVTMLRGLALLARYGMDADPADRDGGIELLTAALPLVPPDLGFLAEAWSELADAHHDRFLALQDQAGLSRSIEAAGRALRYTTADEPLGVLLRLDLAGRLKTRWQLTGDTADRDRAIEYLADFLAAQAGEPPIWQVYGDLLRERGDANDDVSDLSTAIRWLRRSAEASSFVPPRPGEEWLAWHSLGHAHLCRWEITGDTADRDQAISSFGVALDFGVPDAGLALDAHRARVIAAYDQVTRASDDAQLGAGIETGDLFDRAYQALVAWADSEPAAAAELALLLAYAEMAVLRDPTEADDARVRRLLGWARAHPDSTSGWTAPMHGIGGLADLLDQALSHGEPGIPALLGGPAGARARPEASGRVPDAHGPALDDPELALMATIADLMRVHDRGDLVATRRAVREALDLARALPASATAENLLRYLTSFAQIYPIGDVESVDVPTGTGSPGNVPTLMLQLGEVGVVATAAIAAGDAGSLRAARSRIEEIGSPLGPDHPLTPELVNLLGVLSLELARRQPWDTAAADAAVQANTAAVSLTDGGAHPLFVMTALNLAEAHRLRGDAEDLIRSRELGLAALRGHACQVVLESGTDHAVDAARGAAADAHRVAGWCAIDLATDERAGEDLVRALDAGRGFLVHAATTAATVADQLIALGHPELAAEWVMTGGAERTETGGLPGTERRASAPADLRGRVLGALSGVLDAEAPPDVAEIRAALCANGSDALVYVVPVSPGCPGMAVIVAADGPVELLPIPELDVGPGSPVQEYAAACRRVQQATGAGRAPAFQAWQRALRTLGSWAWRAAAGDVLAACAPQCAGRTPRLVLVPVGMLAIVPWHAASRLRAAEVRYLVQDAVTSSIPSARLFCDAVSRSRHPDGAALILGDPSGDLEAAGRQARAIHREFYPDATLLGTASPDGDGGRSCVADGPGIVAELLDWLADHARPRRMLHLACHARVDPEHPAGSTLELSDGSASVTMLLGRRPVGRLWLDTVVVSGRTEVIGESYDEAAGLGTMFLTLGARSVFESLGVAPDRHSVLFLFLVHRFLVAEGCAPAEALHRARLWMLDPNRRIPGTLPPGLTGELATLTPEDPSYWAGVNHLGA